jgi:hypothetical protein
MGRLDDVCNALVDAITAAINGASPAAVTEPGQVIVGDPLAPELVEILAQGPGQWQVSLFPFEKGKNNTRFRPRRTYTQPVVHLTCAAVEGVVTFAGSVDAGLNVHVVIDNKYDARIQTTSGMSLATVATAIVAAINALEAPGITSSASGATATVVGAHTVVCNVAGVGSSIREVARIGRNVRMSVWASDPDTVSAIEGAVLTQLGVDVKPKLTLPDGSLMWVRYAGDLWNDDSQSSYSLYVSHHLFWCEYGVMQIEPAYQIGAVEFISTVNNNAPVTAWYGDA